jgi:hypothetical protein
MGTALELMWLKVGRWTALAGLVAFGVLAGLKIPAGGMGVMGALSLVCWAIFSKLGRTLKAKGRSVGSRG